MARRVIEFRPTWLEADRHEAPSSQAPTPATSSARTRGLVESIGKRKPSEVKVEAGLHHPDVASASLRRDEIGIFRASSRSSRTSAPNSHRRPRARRTRSERFASDLDQLAQLVHAKCWRASFSTPPLLGTVDERTFFAPTARTTQRVRRANGGSGADGELRGCVGSCTRPPDLAGEHRRASAWLRPWSSESAASAMSACERRRDGSQPRGVNLAPDVEQRLPPSAPVLADRTIGGDRAPDDPAAARVEPGLRHGVVHVERRQASKCTRRVPASSAGGRRSRTRARPRREGGASVFERMSVAFAVDEAIAERTHMPPCQRTSAGSSIMSTSAAPKSLRHQLPDPLNPCRARED